MNNKKIIKSGLSLAIVTSLFVGVAVLPASAQTVGVNTSTTAQANLSKIISRSDTAITKRITSLNNLNARVQEMKNVSSTEKTNITNAVQTNSSGLTSLEAKINADTDVTTARADAKTITANYRIYALVMPQGYILAASDRIDTISSMMTALSTKLQTRINTDLSAGKNVATLQSALADISAKVTDAQTQGSSAQSGVINLTPDQGNTTIIASNKAALVAARANIKTATSDFQVARQDIKTITQGLKSLE